MFRAQLIPLRLNKAQRKYMAQAAGTARVAYNWALGEWKRQAIAWWASGKQTSYPSAFALQKQFNALKWEQYPWVGEVSSQVAEKAIFAVGAAYEAYRGGAARYPRFKSRSGRRSFVAASSGRDVRIDGRYVSLPRLGRVRMATSIRWPEARPCGAVISERAGSWFIAINCEVPDAKVKEYPHDAVGVDLGVKSPLVVSAAETSRHFGADMFQRLNVERRKLRRANKRLHRRVKGSGRRDRARHLVGRIHQRMANIRADVQHKATSKIAKLAPVVGLETLAVRNMMRNGRLARSIADVGFYEIRRQLKYKAERVVEADRWYPSSKTCSSCGVIKSALTLSERTFRCECGFQCDRDVNAARNLEHMAANCAVSARGDGSPTRRRKLTLSSLSVKREAGRAGALISQPNDAHLSNQGEKE